MTPKPHLPHLRATGTQPLALIPAGVGGGGGLLSWGFCLPSCPVPSAVTRRTGAHSLGVCPLPPSSPANREQRKAVVGWEEQENEGFLKANFILAAVVLPCPDAEMESLPRSNQGLSPWPGAPSGAS